MTTFAEYFRAGTGSAPYPYQERLANLPCQNLAIQAPTGAGKTAATVLAWLYRLQTDPANTPRRLVYCLPMRVLVEQTRDVVKKLLSNLTAHGLMPGVGVFILMGGELEEEWETHPEKPCVLIGTQDMLLSRALNRGYSMSRYQWPVHFGMLNSDSLWVCDEVQLMGNGLATTAQLQGFRNELGAYGPCMTWWVSATFDAKWISTVNFQEYAKHLDSVSVDEEDRAQTALARRYFASKPLIMVDELNEAKFAELTERQHKQGSLTLVVVNTVERAQKLFAELQNRATRKKGPSKEPNRAELLILHSRFRPGDRQSTLLKMNSELPATGRVLVSTQVIEAGVDISARTLITELAPWSSMVQRFGRCNRAGEFGETSPAQVICVKPPKSDPYEQHELDDAKQRLDTVTDVGISHLQVLGPGTVQPASHVLRKKDLIELFDTTPDLCGADLDVSKFIREKDASDSQIFWRRFDGERPDASEPAPRREELCSVPVYRLAEFTRDHKLFRWDPLAERWSESYRGDTLPGQMYMAKCTDGGYSEMGWDIKSIAEVEPIPDPLAPPEPYGSDRLSKGNWLTISEHTDHVVAQLADLIAALRVDKDTSALLLESARWHDRGKGHAIFQNAVPCDDAHKPGVWAKAPTDFARYQRPCFRHELASALAALKAGAWRPAAIPDRSAPRAGTTVDPVDAPGTRPPSTGRALCTGHLGWRFYGRT